MMDNKLYDRLLAELLVLKNILIELQATMQDAEHDYKWRVSELFKSVVESDEQKFISTLGMDKYLQTKKQKQEEANQIAAQSQNSQQNPKKTVSEHLQFENKKIEKKWAKQLYRKSVKRCHPDLVKHGDNEYKLKLASIYLEVTKAYDETNYAELMLASSKVYVQPNKITNEHIDILKDEILIKSNLLKNIKQSEAYIWSNLSVEQKETFLVNLVQQKGVKLKSKDAVKQVLRKRPPRRKKGEKPQNLRKMRVNK